MSTHDDINLEEKRFNVTATLQVFQIINAVTKEEAIRHMVDYIKESGEGGAFCMMEHNESNADYLINLKCEERDGQK